MTRRVLRYSFGVLFVLLGIVGVFLPILQGWLFFALALLMFFPDHPRVHSSLGKLEPRFPRLVRGLRWMSRSGTRPMQTTGFEQPAEATNPGRPPHRPY